MDLLLGDENPDAAEMLWMGKGADYGANWLVRDPAKAFDDRLGELGGRRRFELGVLTGQSGMDDHGLVQALRFAEAAL